MTETPVNRLIIRLGIPTIISMLIANIYNMADTFFVSSIGTSASGAIGVVFGLLSIIQAFGFMLGHGAGSIVSRFLGKKQVEDASRFASTAFYLSLFAGFLITFVGLFNIPTLVLLLGSTKTIQPYAEKYAFWILLAAPFLTSSCVLNNVLRYEGKAALAMVGLTSGGLLNIALDPLFMFKFGFGVAGAGMATAFSQAVSFSLLLFMFFKGKTESSVSIKYFTRTPRDIGNIISVGSASLIRQGLASVATLFLNHQAGRYGDAAVAAMSITNKATFFIFAVGLGIGQGFQPVSAFNYGAKKYGRVRQAWFFTLFAGVVMMGSLSAVAFVFAPEVIAFFRNDPEVIAVGAVALRCQSVSCLFQPFSTTTNMLFQSLGKAGRAALLSAFRSGLFFIPLIIVLPKLFGLTGVEITQTVADVLTALASVPFAVSFLRELKIREKEKDGEEVY
ncbi:MAG: MATE family efflux transporter [Lachnospiraceae bacterium]|nr:MATE family efflux transporter [Lachnospiraceae bacterium]